MNDKLTDGDTPRACCWRDVNLSFRVWLILGGHHSSTPLHSWSVTTHFLLLPENVQQADGWMNASRWLLPEGTLPRHTNFLTVRKKCEKKKLGQYNLFFVTVSKLSSRTRDVEWRATMRFLFLLPNDDINNSFVNKPLRTPALCLYLPLPHHVAIIPIFVRSVSPFLKGERACSNTTRVVVLCT